MRIPLRLAAALSIPASLLALLSAAEDWSKPPEPLTPDYRAQLDERDLQLITIEVLRTHPLLSASPGIKFVDAYKGFSSEGGQPFTPTEIVANVIFYPHMESRGVKQAFQAHCRRGISTQDWSCFGVEIRRYVRLESQDFEVRVSGNLDIAGIQAVVEATRQPAAAVGLQFSEVADTASSIFACSDGYIVSWGDKNGQGRIGLEARLRAGGNPAEPADWQVRQEPAL